VAGPVKWTERWIARAQRKADLRAERFQKHEERVRAGTEPPGLMDRMETRMTLVQERMKTWSVLQQAYANECHINRGWPLADRPHDAAQAVADAWRTWSTGMPVPGPDGVKVTIWIQSAVLASKADFFDLADRHGLPLRDLPPDDPMWVSWRELVDTRKIYTVYLRRTPAGRDQPFCSFVTETSACWYAVELAIRVRQVGSTGLRPADIFPERQRPGRRDRILAAEIIGVRHGSGHGLHRLPQRAFARWRQIRTGRPHS
jgi:hypothetical protein